MRTTYLSSLFAGALIALMLNASAASAEPDVIAPPTDVHDTDTARETIADELPDGDLNQELSASEDVDGSEVRSYMRKDGAEVTEYSVKGRVYAVRVQPSGNLPAYYLYDDDGDGLFEQRLPGGYKRPSPPMWIIKQF